ncbi:tetratricopeptide repeat protein [Moritella yayanosii]|uniref:PelB C-terminal domain-containing protein n=1 Tax=Moritella yayanosii TaxID=69539 RepID=A0A330LTV3_9GAMM|nr:tetratricopeptide repeat protein [Moritella yayanosii]SQD79248.1 conserved protein of unknown function [Moritella yayanosii]
MKNSSNEVNPKKTSSRIRILALGPLTLLVLSAVYALWLIAPTKATLLTLISRSTSPEISLSFLTELLDRDPDNRQIKLLIAKNIHQLGNIRGAIDVIESLLNGSESNKDWHAHALYVDAVMAGAYSENPQLNAYAISKVEQLFDNTKHIPNVMLARRFADLALSLNMPIYALSILKPHLGSDEISYDELISLALQISDYTTALALLSESLGLTYDKKGIAAHVKVNSPHNTQQIKDDLLSLHKIYRWQGHITKAFEISLLLVDKYPSEPQLRDAIEETKALGDIYHEGLFYDELADIDRLLPDEYADWLNALEKSQGTAVTVLSVKKLMRKHPDDTVLIIELARLYSYTNEYSRVIKLYQQLKKHRSLGFSDAVRCAEAYIMLNQPENALKVLVEPVNWLKADDAYLRMVAFLSWELSQKPLALASQDALIKRSDNNIDVYRYIQLHSPFTEQDIPTLVQLYAKTENQALLLEAINIAYQSEVSAGSRSGRTVKRDFGLKSLMELALQNDAMKDRADVYYYRAMYAVQQQQYKNAHHFFRLSLNSEHLFTPTINSYIWWAIEIQDVNTMRELYDTYGLVLRDNPEFELTFAVLTQQLANLQHADMWYRKYLITNDKTDKTDITVLIHYASLLEELKLYEHAYKLRRYFAENLSQTLDTLPSDYVPEYSLLELIAGDAAAAVLTTSRALLNPSVNSVAQFFQYQQLSGNSDAIRFWQQRTSLADYFLANVTNEQGQVQLDTLTTASISARHYQYGKEYASLSQPSRGNQDDSGKDGYITVMHGRSALRGQYIANTTWDINTLQLDYYQLLKHGDWQLSSYYQTAEPSGIFSDSSIDDEFRLSGLIRYQFNRNEWLFGVDIADGLGDQRLGFNVNYIHQFDRMWRVELGAGLNNDIRASQALALAGSDDVVNAGFYYQPSNRTSMALTLGYHQMSTRFDDEIGTGWSGSLRVTEQLFFSSPAWQIYADYSMHDTDLNSGPLFGISDWLQGSQQITSNDFISSSYQRLAIGQRLYRGAPGVPEQLRQFNGLAQPRYWLDTAVGYNFVTSEPELLLGLGLGWPVIGNDELYFHLDWQSHDRNGEQSLEISVGYFYSF